jgi:hypothetical protein
MLMEVINPYQFVLLLKHFILNNILLTHETIQWAKKSKQWTIFLKVDFFKAYDKVGWDFLFECLKRLGILDAFTLKIMFIGTIAKVNINNKFSKDFLHWKGCVAHVPLGPLYILGGWWSFRCNHQGKKKTMETSRHKTP